MVERSSDSYSYHIPFDAISYYQPSSRFCGMI
jgi:hypothetical protein